MSPPIYTPDGSEVSEIVLPNGATASEVIGPDGNVVFEAAPDIPDSGVSRWEFDEGSGTTATDSWGDNDGTINGATYTTDAKVGSHALSFDGDDYIDVGDIAEFEANGSFSVGCWVRFDTENQFHQIIGKTSTTVNGEWELRTDSSTDAFVFVALQGSDAENAIGTTDPTTGTWYHVVGVYDDPNTTGTVYVDGSEDGENTSWTPQSGTSYPLLMGARDGGTVLHLNGDLDDPRFYDKALTATEVNNWYSTGSIDG